MEFKIDTAKLKALIDERYGSVAEFARTAGISRSQAYAVVNGLEPGAKVIRAIYKLKMDSIFLP